ncbi:hypothetical protein KEM56_000337 [Ascosphaera pollenicola]|nr:hypothetical protein KEM56_000337 [Ascosphaera pollenicola]
MIFMLRNFFILSASFALGNCNNVFLNDTDGLESILCPPSAQDTCTLAILRPLPDASAKIHDEAFAYTYEQNCQKIGNGTKLSHDGTVILDDAPGGSIAVRGYINENYTDAHKYEWAAVKFTHASEESGVLGRNNAGPVVAEQGNQWTCGNVDGISRCHITIHC